MNTTEITINDVSYNDLTVAYAWLIEQTAGTMLDPGHPAMPLALAIEAEIVKRHSASVEFMQAKEQETGCLYCGEDRHPGSDYCGFFQCMEADRQDECPGCGECVYDSTGLDTPDDHHCSDCYGVVLRSIAFHKFGYEFTPNQVDLAVSLVRDGQFDGVAIEAARAALG